MWQQQLPLRDLLQHEFNLKDDQDPLSTLREKFIIGLQYIANNPRQRALMQILYQKCEFSSDMMPEAEIRKRIGFSYPIIRSILQLCIRNGLLPAETNVKFH
ncbi:transcription repressor of multidrug efflux pump acrAB operon [Klebsiella michiganensis]|uniref:Transcription repressor of multidrug efflux pump acrAB operon n=1 Tax=Klebsiella michiganensis TaxID=1134687 RepID=A0A7H4M536_9ENTR|nr:transcription repressor of multidrug efflux pump acrAB operon [Klebsiella michiganensis]